MTSGAHTQPVFRVGSLIYTKAGLFVLFGYLLWGDLCFTLMEQVVPSLLPLLLKEHGATNAQISILVGTIAALLNAVITPTVSYMSDRHRGPRGRRMPYLMWPTPLIVLALVIMPFSPEIAGVLQRFGPVRDLFAHSPVNLVVAVIGVLTVAYQMVNMVVASIYYYLFNDVVPEQFLGRFFSLFRVVGTLGGFLFSYFLYGLAGTHMREIFVGLALLYGLSFAIMFWKVKEGEYPSPPEEPRGSLKASLSNYFRQSFCHPIYRWFYFAYGCYVGAGASVIFWVFFLRDELGLTLDLIGKYRGLASLFVVVLAYPFGVLVDRWKSQRVMLLATAGLLVSNLACFFFISNQWSYLVCVSLWTIFWFLVSIANAVWFPDLLPKSRYGQFASAASMVAALALVGLSPLCGWMLDWTKNYRFAFLWSAVLLAAGFLALIKVHRYWIQLGGPHNYTAPEPDTAEHERGPPGYGRL